MSGLVTRVVGVCPPVPPGAPVSEGPSFVESVSLVTSHVGGDVFISLPVVRGGSSHPKQPKDMASAGVMCFSAADGDNQSVNLRRPMVITNDGHLLKGPLPPADGRDQRVVSAHGDGYAFFINPSSLKHTLVDSNRGDIITVVSEWPVLSAAFHPDEPGEILVTLTTASSLEIHHVPKLPADFPLLAGAEFTKRSHVFHLETGKPSKRATEAGKLPHTIANERNKSPIWVDVAFSQQTPTAPTIVLLLDSDGAVWGAPLPSSDLTMPNVCAKAALNIRLIIPADTIDQVPQTAATSFAWVLSDARAGSYTCVIGRTNGVLDFITTSEHALASHLTRKPGVAPDPRHQPVHAARVPVAGAHAAEATGGLAGIRISQGEGEETQHCLIVTVTPHKPAPPTPNKPSLNATRNAETAEVHLRLSYLVVVPVWDPQDDLPAWKYLLDDDVPIASYDAATPVPLCVPLPSTIVGGRRDDRGCVADVPLDARGGVPLLGHEMVAFIEVHLLPPEEASKAALAWHQPDGIIVNPMMVPIRSLIVSGLHGQLALAKPDGIKWDSAPTGVLPDVVRPLLELGADFHLAVLRTGHDHIIQQTAAKKTHVTCEEAREAIVKPFNVVRTTVDARTKETSTRENKLLDRIATIRKSFDARCADICKACVAAETSRLHQQGLDSVYSLNDQLKEISDALATLERTQGLLW